MFKTLVIFLMLILGSTARSAEIKCTTEISKLTTQDPAYKPLVIVSIFSLLSDPERYDGQRISVIGAFRLYFDRIALYATTDHLKADDSSSMIWVELPKCVSFENAVAMSEWQGMFVAANGVFSAEDRNFSAGTLKQVEMVKLWYDGGEKMRKE